MTAVSTELSVERTGLITHVTLTRPEKSNALSAMLVESLLAALSEAENNGTTLMVFRGQGRNFCSGFDLGNLDRETDGDLLLRLVRIELLLQRITYAPFVTLALAQGNCIGAGCDLFCACSERIAVQNASFRMPGWRFGIALGTRRLIARIGIDAARSVLLSSRSFDALEARELGLVSNLAEHPEWDSVVAIAAQRAGVLTSEARSLLLRLTMPDTRAVDMAALVESASVPGLKRRISLYYTAKRTANKEK